MSRRHHGRPHHPRYRHESPRPDGASNRPTAPAPIEAVAPLPEPGLVQPAPRRDGAEPEPDPTLTAPTRPAAPATLSDPADAAPGGPQPRINGLENGNGAHHGERPNGCTAPQLRRFIKSRPYVPMHELRRRFAIDGTDDDVTQVDIEGGRVYVGLPAREGSLLGELLRGGEVGYELSFDPLAPIVVGVYPMRPVPRT